MTPCHALDIATLPREDEVHLEEDRRGIQGAAFHDPPEGVLPYRGEGDHHGPSYQEEGRPYPAADPYLRMISQAS